MSSHIVHSITINSSHPLQLILSPSTHLIPASSFHHHQLIPSSPAHSVTINSSHPLQLIRSPSTHPIPSSSFLHHQLIPIIPSSSFGHHQIIPSYPVYSITINTSHPLQLIPSPSTHPIQFIPSSSTHTVIINPTCVAVVCAVGHFYNTSSRLCEPCGTGHYQPDTGQTSCFSCAIGKTTRTLTATKATECFGEWLDSVIACHLH